VARERIAVRGDEHQFASPSAHARLRIFCVIIGHNEFDVDLAPQAFFGALKKFDGAVELVARGEEMLTVCKGPSVILHVCEFDPAGAGGFTERQDLFKLIDVAAVNDKIQRQRHTAPFNPIEDAEFLCMRFSAGDFVGELFVRALKTELKVVETRLDEIVEPRLIERESGSDEVHVEPGMAGGADEIYKIGAGERLATGKINLENARIGGFA